MAQTDRKPKYGDLCRDEADVLWCVVDVTDNLVYTMTSTNNPDSVQNAIDGEYNAIVAAELAEAGDEADLGKHPNYGCWLREDWAALPAVPR